MLFSILKSLDLYRKIPRDLTEPTVSGATLSVIAILLALYLFFGELSLYLSPSPVSRMMMESIDDNSRLQVNIDITFPRLPCELVAFDAQDAMGSHASDIEGHFFAERLSSDGNIIERDTVHATINSVLGHGLWVQGLFGNSGERADVVARVTKMLEHKEGCRMFGHVRVNKVPGLIHFSAHSFTFLFGLYNQLTEEMLIDMSHKVNHLSFGDDADIDYIRNSWKGIGIIAPLDSMKKKMSSSGGKLEPVIFEYYCKIVPTTYFKPNWSSTKKVFQFTANSNVVPTTLVPSIYIRYDLSPVRIEYTWGNETSTLAHFLVQVCAIVGGVFTVAGLIDSITHKSIVFLARKAQLRKLG